MVVAVGNFDGVHLGHAAVIRRACTEAKKRGEKTLVFTFENHPRAFFGKEFKYLVSNKKRRELILSIGADDVYFQKFDYEFAEKSPVEFISYLKNKFNCTAVVCGADFRFGRGAEGNPKNVSDIDIIIVGEVDVDGFRVSSTRIRSLISDGYIADANKLLGYVFSISAIVSHGKHLGTKLGFPTLNQKVKPDLILPKNGVYATAVYCFGEKFCGVTNIGVRPSVDDGDDITVETYLLDLSERRDLYGVEAEIFFLERLRDEKKFDSLEELTKQISLDCHSAKHIYDNFNFNL
ncbi:MAG: bifunctional riboflavin kinase/FMN adenylyltransferase [Clostridiales bacterium]|nr:MAG: bifunctional riboflavin kinase/FMN adenylyltransferase [Clostridiales bacterium]